MKYSQLLLGFIAGCCFFFLISAKPGVNEADGVPRYHMSVPSGDYIYVHDAVTGKWKRVYWPKAKNVDNIKTILESEE